jgi:hypothetical protein
LGGARHTGLHRSVVGGALALSLTSILQLEALIAILWLERGTLRKLITWRELTTISLIRWISLLVALLEASALTSVASRSLSLEPLPFSIHLLALIVNHNSVIHQCLIIGVSIEHQLQLQTIIQTL